MDPDKNELDDQKKIRLALILLALGYKQNAIDLLEEISNFNNEDLQILIKEFDKIKFRKKILKIYNSLPYVIYGLFRKLIGKRKIY